jgi:catechol 2,3-dioxygenase-like lactoylglutathione lyase family enzyme
MRMDSAMLFVKDLGEMTAFYRDVIGFRPVEQTKRDDWIEFDAGGATFELHAIPDNIAEAVEIASPPVPRQSQSCKLILAVDDLDAEQARLAAAGVTILHRPWGGWDMVDPEGNVLGVRPARG